MTKERVQSSAPKDSPQNTLTASGTFTTAGRWEIARIRRYLSVASLGHILTGVVAVMAAGATALNLPLVQVLERQAQALFFELRGPVTPPNNIVILAIDEESLAQEEFYQDDPKQYSFLEPIQAWPWKRSAYAQVIDKLMVAGARTVSVDVVLDKPGIYGVADDQALQQTLERYAGRVTLAALYEEVETRSGPITQLTVPQPLFQTEPKSFGSINFLVEPNGKIHQLASQFIQLHAQSYPEQGTDFAWQEETLSFAQATLQAAQLAYPEPKGSDIFFYGPQNTFTYVPFWYVLDPNQWNTYLQRGEYFKDKIVLIGSTATLQQDFHAAPFSRSWLYPVPMAGIEIQANSVATLLEGKAIAELIPYAPLQGLVVLLLIAGSGFLITRSKQVVSRFSYATGLAIAWGIVGYIVFIHARAVIPSAVPVVAIALSGLSYLTTGSASEYLRKQRLRHTLQHYAASPIVQEIISQQDDLQDLLQEREQALFGKKLAGRYQVVKVLGSGGFSETYIAEDTQRPGNPQCVVKQLRPISNNPKFLQVAEKLFEREAKALEKLGKHDQIPQLLANFTEDNEFYLVQEYIVGHPLNHELSPGRQTPVAKVIAMLQDLLTVLEFVHSHNVIHRDIKPSNIIRRISDGKLVLIDFGVVKEISQLVEEDEQTKVTVGIGTQGYMPSEQTLGMPQFNSDIYAVGITAIEALTGLSPSKLQHDPKTGEILWMYRATVNPELASILAKMVRYDFSHRYQSASEVLADLQNLKDTSPLLPLVEVPTTSSLADDVQDSSTPTMPWPEGFGMNSHSTLVEPPNSSS